MGREKEKGEKERKKERKRKKKRAKGNGDAKRKRKRKSKGNGERKREKEGKGESEEGKREEKGRREDREGNCTATISPTGPRDAPARPGPARPSAPTPVAVHDAPAARLQHRVAARLALEVQPDGQHAAGAVVVEHDLGELPRVDRAQHGPGRTRALPAWRRHRGPAPAAHAPGAAPGGGPRPLPSTALCRAPPPCACAWPCRGGARREGSRAGSRQTLLTNRRKTQPAFGTRGVTWSCQLSVMSYRPAASSSSCD